VRLLLGEILVASKAITRTQLESALKKHRLNKRQIGDILLEAGYLQENQLKTALKIQKRMVATTIASMMGAFALTACGAPIAPSRINDFEKYVSYDKVRRLESRRYAAAFQQEAMVSTHQFKDGRQVQDFADGSRVIKDVPFFRQGRDNTCGQAAMTVIMQFWGVEQDYQELINRQNAWNTATSHDKITKTLTEGGFKVKAFRQGNFDFIKKLVDLGRPSIAMLEFNNDLFQQHYVVVLGYNEEKNTVIFHDSIDGPYRQLEIEEFKSMWDSPNLSRVPVLGNGNYKGLVFDVIKDR
jgi:hypothetical protein